MKNIIETSLAKAMTYAEYNLLFKQLVEEEKTTGEQTEEKIKYTKLNYSRTKRIDKTAKISEDIVTQFQNLTTINKWLVITEPWCGDAAQTLPYLNKLVQLSENGTMKIVLRDDNPELMDHFLTNGSRSIPIFILLDTNNNVLHYLGPRSQAATNFVEDYKAKKGLIDDALKEQLQVWYNDDKGVSIVNDFADKIRTLL